MLQDVDLQQKLSREEYKQIVPNLWDRLYQLQWTTWREGVPVVLVFESWDAAGKGGAIRAVTRRLDPRGYEIHSIQSPRGFERRRPWMWRFWRRMPERGQWGLFDRSWYRRVLIERVEKEVPETLWRRAYRDIVEFERTFNDAGYLVLKFFLHISKREQKKRFKKLTKDPFLAWQVTAEDWEHHSKYSNYRDAVEEMLELTDTPWTPWTIVPASDRRHARVEVFRTIIARIEGRLVDAGIPLPTVTEPVVADLEDSVSGMPPLRETEPTEGNGEE